MPWEIDRLNRDERILDMKYRINKIGRLNANGKTLLGETRFLISLNKLSHQSQWCDIGTPEKQVLFRQYSEIADVSNPANPVYPVRKKDERIEWRN